MDLLCRWSGEVLILQRPSATPHQALGDSERLRGRCRCWWIVWVTRHAITARFGVSRQGGHNPSSLVGAAELKKPDRTGTVWSQAALARS